MNARPDPEFESTLPRIVFDRLVAHHESQLELCSKLEKIADSLPGEVSPSECLGMSRTVYPTVKKAHQFEEETLFPLVQTMLKDTHKARITLERLQFEHWEDESYAEEISEALRHFVTDPESVRPDTLAYMLRGFFEGLRRHIAFETEHLMPLLAGEGIGR